jgi:hypothetical protein
MAPPSKLGVAIASVQRFIKDEASYHKEQEQQEARIQKLQQNPEDENAEYMLKQEVCSILLHFLCSFDTRKVSFLHLRYWGLQFLKATIT